MARSTISGPTITFTPISVSAHDDDDVVVYSSHPLIAPRLWLTLDIMGVGERRSLLDGGLPAWTEESRPLSTEAPAAPAGATVENVDGEDSGGGGFFAVRRVLNRPLDLESAPILELPVRLGNGAVVSHSRALRSGTTLARTISAGARVLSSLTPPIPLSCTRGG